MLKFATSKFSSPVHLKLSPVAVWTDVAGQLAFFDFATIFLKVHFFGGTLSFFAASTCDFSFVKKIFVCYVRLCVLAVCSNFSILV